MMHSAIAVGGTYSLMPIPSIQAMDTKLSP